MLILLAGLRIGRDFWRWIKPEKFTVRQGIAVAVIALGTFFCGIPAAGYLAQQKLLALQAEREEHQMKLGLEQEKNRLPTLVSFYTAPVSQSPKTSDRK
jgi:hypothetical protein